VSRLLSARLLVPASVLLIGLAVARFVIVPGVTGAARASHFVQAALMLLIVTALHRTHRRRVGAIEARLKELRRLVQTLHAANENGAPRRQEPPAA
jgi:hypothetical protein